MSNVDALKDAGNKAFAAKNYDQAIQLFSDAIQLNSNNHVLYSNRSAAHAGSRNWSAALVDAESAIRCNPAWAKGYARKGAALHGARRWDEAMAAYEEGLKIEDSPALRKGLQEVKDAKENSIQNQDSGASFSNLFQQPDAMAKLASNPKTAPFLADPSFVQQLQLIQQNPQLVGSAMNDPRIITALGVLLGIDMQAFSRPEGSDELPPELQSGSSSHGPRPEQNPEPEPKEETKENSLRKEADEQKQLGSAAYRQRDFAEAARAFSKAWEIWPKDITYLTNLSAVCFEQGDYDRCIQVCEQAINEGRDLRADYKLIAKALGRIGSAYAKKGEITSAIKYLEKSLTEHRTPDVLNKLRQIEKEKAEADRKAYINPEISAEERERGNALFKAGDFAGAVSAYSEAIRRDPSDPRGYNNRATAYTKLVALPEALKDAEFAIDLDPKFVKAHIRKATVLFTMKDYVKAMEAVGKASDADFEKKHTSEIEGLMFKVNMALSNERAGESEEQTLQRAMRDPEVAAIMTDPVMQSILQQAQSNPAALQEHMKNPMIQQKIIKLVQAGVIKTGPR